MIKLKELIESDDDGFSISKIEEAQAVNYINKVIILNVIDNIYNEFLSEFPRASIKDFPRVGYNTLRKNLKKTNHEYNKIVYHIKLTNRVLFRFTIEKILYKDKLPKIKILLDSNIGGLYQTKLYWINSTDLFISENKDEKTTESDNSITREDELRGLQYIRKILIPKSVIDWNTVAYNYPEVTEDEVRKKIVKKIANGYDDESDTHYITYQSHFLKDGKPIVINFFINKSSRGLYVSYQNLMGNSGEGSFIYKSV